MRIIAHPMASDGEVRAWPHNRTGLTKQKIYKILITSMGEM